MVLKALTTEIVHNDQIKSVLNNLYVENSFFILFKLTGKRVKTSFKCKYVNPFANRCVSIHFVGANSEELH
jgi:hypothetical protein